MREQALVDSRKIFGLMPNSVVSRRTSIDESGAGSRCAGADAHWWWQVAVLFRFPGLLRDGLTVVVCP